jgi:hypothetical protein
MPGPTTTPGPAIALVPEPRAIPQIRLPRARIEHLLPDASKPLLSTMGRRTQRKCSMKSACYLAHDSANVPAN